MCNRTRLQEMRTAWKVRKTISPYARHGGSRWKGSRMRRKQLAATFAVVIGVALAACGGGSSKSDKADPPPVVTNPPPTNPPPANQAPVAQLSVTPTSGQAALTVSADASASSDTDGTIASTKI